MKADLYGAGLMKAFFCGMQLAGASFAEASLFGSDLYLSLSRPDPSTDFKGADNTHSILLLDGESLVR
jgi:uncharacterized protein YjbI with pentapeptide repeats